MRSQPSAAPDRYCPVSCDLLINGTAALRSSRGVTRFYSSVMQHLRWAGRIELINPSGGRLERLRELSLRGRRDAILWSPSHRGPLHARHHVVSVHDCINVEYTYRGDWRLPFFRQLFNVVLAQAESVVALSRATRDAILRNYRVDPGKIVVIPASFDALRASEEDVSVGRSGEPFILMVANGLPHKNTEGAAAAFARSRAAAYGVGLRVVGSVSPAASTLLHESGARFQSHSAITDATLASWYANCRFLLAPSFEEGFDLPVAEALASGANVLCSSIPAHQEFFAGYAEFFDPHDGDGLVDALNLALDREMQWHPPFRNARTCQSVADDYRALFQGIEDNLPSTR